MKRITLILGLLLSAGLLHGQTYCQYQTGGYDPLADGLAYQANIQKEYAPECWGGQERRKTCPNCITYKTIGPIAFPVTENPGLCNGVAGPQINGVNTCNLTWVPSDCNYEFPGGGELYTLCVNDRLSILQPHIAWDWCENAQAPVGNAYGCPGGGGGEISLPSKKPVDILFRRKPDWIRDEIWVQYVIETKKWQLENERLNSQ